jgi:hypothetical protein
MIKDIKYFFRRKYRQIRRVIDFLPMIWNGFDFDYMYAIELFEKQLERTADFMESDRATTVDADKRAKRIRTAVALLKKTYDEEYACEYQDQLKEIFGENVLDFRFEPTEHNNGSSYLKWEYEYWDNADEVNKVRDVLYKASHAKQRKAEDLVWRYIGHNIRGWWD